MIKDGINGFCMALADSVPGVSGGTIAFIMGFYDRFIGSIHDLAFGDREAKREALRYLLRLGIGWLLGMAMAVLLLSSLFESHIHMVCSLFFGFILGSIPLIVEDELECLRKISEGFVFCLLGMFLVIAVTVINGKTGGASMDLGKFSVFTATRLFFIGMISISAMFLPGISGSTLLLVFGAYMPVITAVKEVLSLNFSYISCLSFFVCGMIGGALTVVKAIKICLERFRPQTVYLSLGMMIGSLYAVGMGPTTLEVPQKAMNMENFHIISAIVGVILVFGMKKLKERV